MPKADSLVHCIFTVLQLMLFFQVFVSPGQTTLYLAFTADIVPGLCVPLTGSLVHCHLQLTVFLGVSLFVYP